MGLPEKYLMLLFSIATAALPEPKVGGGGIDKEIRFWIFVSEKIIDHVVPWPLQKQICAHYLAMVNF